MPLNTELRKEIETRLAAIEKQIQALNRAQVVDPTGTGVHLYMLEREKALREDQLRRGRA